MASFPICLKYKAKIHFSVLWFHDFPNGKCLVCSWHLSTFCLNFQWFLISNFNFANSILISWFSGFNWSDFGHKCMRFQAVLGPQMFYMVQALLSHYSIVFLFLVNSVDVLPINSFTPLQKWSKEIEPWLFGSRNLIMVSISWKEQWLCVRDEWQ